MKLVLKKTIGLSALTLTLCLMLTACAGLGDALLSAMSSIEPAPASPVPEPVKDSSGARYVAHDVKDELANTFSQGSVDYFVYYLGSIADVPISWETARRWDGRTPITCSFSTTEGVEKMVSTSEETTLTHIESSSNTVSVEATVSASAPFAEFSLSVGWEGSWAKENQKSATSTLESAETYMSSHTSSDEITVGGDMPVGFYRLTLFVQSDVYAILWHDASTDKWGYIYKTCPKDSSYYYAIDYSADDASFSKSTDNSEIVFDAGAHITEIQQKSYTVTFNSNGGSAVAALTTPKGDKKLSLPANPTLANNYFVGWYTEPEFTTKVTSATFTPMTNRTLYAKWTATTQTITWKFDGEIRIGDGGTSKKKHYDPYYTSFEPITLDLAALKAAGYKKVHVSWYMPDWDEGANDGDSIIRLDLEYADNATGTKSGTFWASEDLSIGDAHTSRTYTFDLPIDSVVPHPYVRCNFWRRETSKTDGDYYLRQGTTVTLTAQK
jgi:uncharacterized repeat protein (TIGR02543 family)